MTWSTSQDIDTFLAAAEDFLSARPVDNTVLLTEAAYLRARPAPPGDQLFGWWQPTAGGPVRGAFLRAPGHPAILSPLPDEAVTELAAVFPELPPIGVDGRQVDIARRAWPGLRRTPGLTVFRLAEFRPPLGLPPGRERAATLADRDLLVGWYRSLMAAHPGDPSDLAYVVDDPLSYGGITLWEVAGEPRAMAGRSRLVAGMVRLGAVHSTRDPVDGDAAFAAACATAAEIADHVLVFAAADDHPAAGFYRGLGFAPAGTRMLLAK